jgi:hypothetical protein
MFNAFKNSTAGIAPLKASRNNTILQKPFHIWIKKDIKKDATPIPLIKRDIRNYDLAYPEEYKKYELFIKGAHITMNNIKKPKHV